MSSYLRKRPLSKFTREELILAVVAAACLALKFLFHAHFSWFGGGFWGAVVLAAALVVLAHRARGNQPRVFTNT